MLDLGNSLEIFFPRSALSFPEQTKLDGLLVVAALESLLHWNDNFVVVIGLELTVFVAAQKLELSAL